MDVDKFSRINVNNNNKLDELNKEDEPADVRLATPVKLEIERGLEPEIIKTEDRLAENPLLKSVVTKEETKKHLPEQEMIKVKILERHYKFKKTCLIPREQLSPQQHLELLSKPSKPIQRCPELLREELRPALPLPRTQKLALPLKRTLLATLEEKCCTLPDDKIQNILNYIEMTETFSSEEGSEIIDMEKCGKTFTSCEKKASSPSLKKELDQKIITSMDKDSVCYQYELAQKFVCSILNWKCKFPSEDYKDLAKVVFKRMCKEIDFTPPIYADRKSDQIKFLSDIIACWIMGVMYDLALDQKDELNKQIETDKQKDKEKEANKATENKKEDELKLAELRRLKEQQEEKKRASIEKLKEDKRRKLEELKKQKEEEESKKKKKEEKTDKKVETDKPETRDVGTNKIFALADQLLAEVVSLLSDMLEDVKENDGCDRITNEIHEALSIDVTSMINKTQSKNLAKKKKNVYDICGKIAMYLSEIISECIQQDSTCSSMYHSENNYEDKKEVIVNATKLIKHWTDWLQCKINHFEQVITSKSSKRELEAFSSDFLEGQCTFKKVYNRLSILEKITD